MQNFQDTFETVSDHLAVLFQFAFSCIFIIEKFKHVQTFQLIENEN